MFAFGVSVSGCMAVICIAYEGEMHCNLHTYALLM